MWTLAVSAGTALQHVPEAANEEQKVPYRCRGGADCGEDGSTVNEREKPEPGY